MTDETKKLFDAPWKRANNLSRNGSGKVRGRSQSRIVDASGRPVAYAYPTGKQKITANRLARLPELYDALVDAALGRCWACSRNGSDILESGCPKKNDVTCYVSKWLDLLKKVRDGK